MSESVLKRTKNAFRCVGYVNEKKLIRENCEIKIKDVDGKDDGVITGERIRGEVVVRCEDGLHSFKVFFQSHNAKPNNSGNHDNNRWTMATAMLDWNPEINGNGEPATLVAIEGSLDINDFFNPNNGNVASTIVKNISSANTKVEPDESHSCSWNGITIVKSIADEVVNEEETGRKIVELIGVNSKSEVMPIKAYVDKEFASDFEGVVEEGETRNFNLEESVRHIGGASATPKKKAFGRDTKNSTNRGFDRTEWMIVGCDDVIEEVEGDEGLIDNGYLNPQAIKKGIKERAKKLEELKNNPAPTKKSSFSEKKAQAKKEAFTSDDDDENPFGDF